MVGCANTDKSKIVKTVVYMAAEEIGYFVGGNSPNLAEKAEPYYTTLCDLYDDGDMENVAIMVGFGAGYLLTESGLSEKDSARLQSKITKLSELVGMDAGLDIDKIKELDSGTVKEAVDGFMSGLRITG